MSYIDNFDVKKRHSLGTFFDYLKNVESGMNGDMKLQVTPATLGTEASVASASFSRTVQVELVNDDGDILRFFNGNVAVATSDSSNGTEASNILDDASEITLTNGVGEVTAEYTGTWTEGDTQTIEVGSVTIMGYTVSQADSVDTIVADS